MSTNELFFSTSSLHIENVKERNTLQYYDFTCKTREEGIFFGMKMNGYTEAHAQRRLKAICGPEVIIIPTNKMQTNDQ